MKRQHTILIGKSVKKIAALRGGGSALPGLVVEKLDKHFVKHTLEQLPKGVVLISGTNGKTTTTKMVAELLTGSGLKVFTNKTGSNFTRGVAAALISAVDNKGVLDYDIAVLELDEAYATHFVKQVAPRHVLLLNVMRDQLDRFGEIDHTARLLELVAKSATEGVILNRDDPRVSKIADLLSSDIDVNYFSSSTKLRSLFINDDEISAPKDQKVTSKALPLRQGDVELTAYQDNTVIFTADKKQYKATLKLSGVYNFLNAAGALALAKQVLGKAESYDELTDTLEDITPAFGRGEILTVNGKPLELILVKNPAGFRLALSSFKPAGTNVMIAINDHYADGRDMSWLWDVDFSGLQESGVQMVSGIRAYDMALRLQYDDVLVNKVDTDLQNALRQFINHDKSSPKRIFCTYTAMTNLRKLLQKYAKVERIS